MNRTGHSLLASLIPLWQTCHRCEQDACCSKHGKSAVHKLSLDIPADIHKGDHFNCVARVTVVSAAMQIWLAFFQW